MLLLLLACNDNVLSVALRDPEVIILGPVEGSLLEEGQPLTLTVQASDRETPTDQLTLVWSLEDGTILGGEPTIDGETVTLLLAEGLRAGEHRITVLVTDNDAMSADDSVGVNVSPPVDRDVDGDGYESAELGGTDCDDTDGTAHPDAEEVCDGVDQDCDGLVDEDAVRDTVEYYADEDGDSAGTPSIAITACTPPPGYVDDASDCDDADPAEHPGADEVCDGDDDDCDGVIDEDDAIDAGIWHPDNDGDGYGGPGSSVTSCSLPDGFSADASDCDDTDAVNNPGADEVCDGEDDDCDGAVDEDDAIDAGIWHADADGDSFGDASAGTPACRAPSGYLADATDCDDRENTVYPGAAESCDGTDQDCDGVIDDGVESTFYADSDGDGYGSAGATASACSAPSGYLSDATDCDDTDAAEHPGASELCDGDDDNCDGVTDENSAIDAPYWYADADADAYGDAADSAIACDAPVGYTADATDCDDADEYVSPGAREVCEDGADQDCDGLDVHCPFTGSISLGDADASVYGARSSSQVGDGVIHCGDLDDDGLDDVMVTGDDSIDRGEVWLFVSALTGSNSTGSADMHSQGGSSADALGIQQGNGAGARDLNGDGSDDLVIGAAGDDLGATNAGTISVFYGPVPLGELDPTGDADYLYRGAASYDFAGNSVALLDDMTSDRYGELLIGAYGADGGGSLAGAAYVNFAPLGSYSSSGTSLGFSDVVLQGEDASDSFGWSVASAGDWDGDGLDDVLVGAYGDDSGGSDAGAAYIFTGLSAGAVDASAAEYKVYGEAAGDRLAYRLSPMGDADADGYADIVVSAYTNDGGGTDAGAVYIVPGNASGSASISAVGIEITGVDTGDNAGYSVSGGGDMDGDGWTDLLIGAWLNSASANDAGAAYLVYGPFTGPVDLGAADATAFGVDSSDHAGSSASFIGDTNADGAEDILIGASGAGGVGQGYLILGGPR